MSHRTFNLQEVAAYLQLTQEEVEKNVRQNEIPYEKKGDRLIFRRNDIDAWASQRIIGSKGQGLRTYRKKSSRKPHPASKEHAMLPELLKLEYIAPALNSKTKASLVADMVDVAESTGLLLQPEQLHKSLREREQMCSTALGGGIALLHPRTHDPYMFSESFIVMGRTLQPIPFGSPDGMTTDLFFLVCCQDDRAHLHVLARLCMLCYHTSVLLELREANTAAEMLDLLLKAEKEVIQNL